MQHHDAIHFGRNLEKICCIAWHSRWKFQYKEMVNTQSYINVFACVYIYVCKLACRVSKTCTERDKNHTCGLRDWRLEWSPVIPQLIFPHGLKLRKESCITRMDEYRDALCQEGGCWKSSCLATRLCKILRKREK